MSNLSQQFDANDQQKAAAIRNNKTRLTRVLKPRFLGPRKRSTNRAGQGRMTAGVVYTPIDENQTLIHWQPETFGSLSPEMKQHKHGVIFNVLQQAGFNVSMRDDQIHVQH